MISLLLIFLTVPFVTHSCVLLSDDAKPKGLEERAIDSEVVLAAYTRTVYKTKNNTTSYSAEFLVFNILKGEKQVTEIYQQRKPSPLETALNRRLVNASNFGDPSKCQSDVNPGETYILFFDVTADGHLTARYDGVYGPAVVYSRDKELALEAIGSSPWSEWSPCSGSCGGGIQQRRRQCDDDTQCSNQEGQQRTCNMFSCTGTLNALEAANVHRSSLRPSGRPSAYKLLPSGTWRSREEEIIFPRTFPWEFSLLVTVRVKQTSSGGFLLRVLHSGSLQVGLYISDTITLVLSDKDNIRVIFVKSLFDDHWNQIAFSVRRNTVSFFVNCEFNGKLPIIGKIRPFGGQPATVIVGSTGPQELDAFQGDIEQITISGSPDDAEKQCNSTTQPLQYRTGHFNPREEVRSRPISHHSTQNDQLPLRGDIIDDEDFSFDENGSGYKSDSPDDDYDDDYDDDEKATDKHRKEKDKIPLKSDPENPHENSIEDEDDEDSDDVDDVNEEEDDSVKNKDVVEDFEVEESYKKPYEELVKPTVATDKPDIYQKDEKHEEPPKTQKELSEKTSSVEKSEEKKKTEDVVIEDTIYRDDYDYNHPDEEMDQKEETFEGSGAGTNFELAWSEWSPCSSTCNWGRRTRTSYCVDNGVNLDSCSEASSKRTETEACFAGLCPTSSTPPSSTTSTTTTTSESPINVYNKSIASTLFEFISFKTHCKIKCLNGGTCHPPYKCRCLPGFHGNMCQYALCKPSCLNGGSCVAPNKCRCKPGYIGKSCHKAICQQGCKNGGECVAPNKCACRSGFTGKDCGEPLCDPVCQNGGTCVKPYFCHCPPGTKGAFCEKLTCKIDCLNGGTCISPGTCACARGFTGYNCEQTYCPGGCFNGGKCGKTGKCSCPSGYSGLHCEIRKPCKFVEVKEPYKRGFKRKVATHVKVPCGAWGWKMCTKTKVHYETVYKTFFRTSYECETLHSKYPEYHKLKTG